MATARRIYWDACAWIALIQREEIRDSIGVLTEDRYGMCRNVINAAAQNQIEIATSTLSYAEVCKEPKVKAVAADKLAAYFENDYVLPINLDRAVGERARELLMKGYSKLRPPDACHIASAALSNAEEMHTFDDKLLVLDGQIDKADGTKLKICKPDPGGPPAPLLDAMQKGTPNGPPPPSGAEKRETGGDGA
jgi:predicted nucleic acid-binding protein